MPVSTLRHWENDLGFPGVPAFPRLAEALGVPTERLAKGVDDLAGDEPEPAPRRPRRTGKEKPAPPRDAAGWPSDTGDAGHTSEGDYHRLPLFPCHYHVFSQGLATARTSLQTALLWCNLNPHKDLQRFSARADVPLPKLDVAGSNPVARSGRKHFAERELQRTRPRRTVRPEALEARKTSAEG